MILAAHVRRDAERNATVDLPVLSRAAAIVPNSLDEEARTVDVIWTTGAAVLRGFYDRYWEELSLDPKHVRLKRLNNGAPVLNAHNDRDARGVIGVVVPGSARIENGRGIATVRFAKAEDDAAADEIWRKVKDGILQNVSVGYSTYKMEEVEAGKDKVKRFRATDWEPYEISPVPMGADDGAGFRAESTTAKRTACVFVTRTATANKDRTMDPENDPTTPAPQGSPTAAADAAQEAAATAATAATRRARMEERAARDAAAAQAAEDAIAGERARVAGIRKIAQQSRLGDGWATSLIEAGVSAEKAREVAFREITSADSEHDVDGVLRIGAGDDARDKFLRGATAWLIERTGKRKLLEQAKKRAPDLFEGFELGGGGEFRGLSPVELARESLERAGRKTRGMDRMRMLGEAFTFRSGSYQTTSDFATLLENVLHKMLLGAYATQETTWQRFCGTDDVPDFRTSSRYRTGSLPSLPKISEHGEYTTGIVPDGAKYGISTERHGEIFSLSREAILNDDMGALANLAGEFGRAAARTIENDVYALLALNSGLGPTMSDSQPFFHANRANVGTGSALTVAGLDADRVLMRAQKDPSNRDYLSLSPRILVVPDALEGTARVINDAQYDPDTANKLQRPNMVRGLFGDIVGTPRLASNTTRRYLFADPNICAAIVVAFLEGYGRGPIMESQNGWRIDGVEWKVTQYAKAQEADAKGAVTNAGA